MSTYLNEILEQPDALERLAEAWKSSETLSSLAAGFRAHPGPLVFVGMGSSNFAPIVLRSRLSGLKLEYRILEAGELLHYEMDSIAPESWVIAISQSGDSYETRVVAEKLRGKVRRIVAMTNERNSPIARAADDVLLLHAGPEIGSTTKTFTNTLLALHLLIDRMTGRTTVDEKALSALLSAVRTLCGRLEPEMREWVDHLHISPEVNPDPIHIVARGPMVATAYQSALILAETTDIYVSAFAGGTFRHGAYELTGPNHRAIFLAPSGPTADILVRMAREIHDRGSRIVLVTDLDDDFPFPTTRMPSLDEALAPMAYFLPFEFFGYNVATLRGREPGIMRNMGKVTNVE